MLDEEAERLFLGHYLANGFNATRAYLSIRPNVRTNTAATEGHKLRHRPAMDAAIRARLAEAWKQLEMESAEAIARLALIVRADARDAVDDEGKLLPLHQWPDGLAIALEAYDGDDHKFKLASKLGALRMILELKKELGGVNDLASLIAAATERGRQLRGGE